MLTEAVFPFYIIHQTVIVVVGYAIVGRGIAPGAEFAILLAATVAGCWGFYLIGREIGWLRPLIGLGVAKARTSATPRGAGRLDPADPRWRRASRAREDCAWARSERAPRAFPGAGNGDTGHAGRRRQGTRRDRRGGGEGKGW